jgi:FtsP/CotA-like multicopper oxidase with cupredoxin domain
MMNQRTHWLGLVLALFTGAALLAPGSALALPAGAPKVGMVCLNGTTFNLVAKSGTIHTPDGNTVFMWSYANADSPDSGAFQYPGPVLCVNQGDAVTVNLTNNLPEPASIIFPGQDSAVTAAGGAAGLMTNEAASGGAVSYTFTAVSPGTYLYQSGSDISKQVEMGLYGALIVRPAGHADYAYDASTQFDPGREYMLLLAEIDPDLHHAVEEGGVFDFTALHNHYYTINGRAFPDTIQDNGSALLPTQPYGAMVRLQPNTGANPQPALIRMLNAGALNHPFHPHGNHTREIAQDGRPIKTTGSDASTEHFGETIGSGQTLDYLIRWDNVATDTAGQTFNDNWDPNSNPLPVPQPNYLNLTFKGGDTWYSGNPYLGYKGTLPVGTVSQNICGEWYFPFHSHALDEFSNYDEGFGGMGTLLRVDPAGGCFAAPSGTGLVGAALKSGGVGALAANDGSYYQVNPKPAGAFATDWYASFTGVAPGAQNLKITYAGRNCGNTAGAGCTDPGAPAPAQTTKICDWTIAGAAGCSTATSTGWVTLPAPQGAPVGSTDVSTTWTLPGPAGNYVGRGVYAGQVRVLVHTERSGGPTFSTWGNFMQVVYDAP